MIQKRYPAQGGFILLETMLALLILGVLLTVCIQSIANILRVCNSTHNIMGAAACGQSLLAEGTIARQGTGYNRGTFGEGNGGFSWRFDMQTADDPLQRYTYTVQWPERGAEKSLEFMTATANVR
jgi:type II secretory pathway pseudopilin PulG